MEFSIFYFFYFDVWNRFVDENETLLQKEEITFIGLDTAPDSWVASRAFESARNDDVNLDKYFEEFGESVIEWSFVAGL